MNPETAERGFTDEERAQLKLADDILERIRPERFSAMVGEFGELSLGVQMMGLEFFVYLCPAKKGKL